MMALTTFAVLTAALLLSSQTLPAAGEHIPLVFAGSLRAIEPPADSGGWVLQVISRGGLDGRGSEDLTISSDGRLTMADRSNVVGSVPLAVLSSLREHISALTPSRWTKGSRLTACSDCVVTLIALTVRDAQGSMRTYVAYWDVVTEREVPPDVRRIYELAVGTRR